jgi:1,3-beta-glucan synthase
LHAVLGLVAVIFIQRAIHKILISVLLTREFKHDETNKAWWTGRWYGRNLGAHIMSQPAREFVVKIIELSLWSSDFLIGHVLDGAQETASAFAEDFYHRNIWRSLG